MFFFFNGVFSNRKIKNHIIKVRATLVILQIQRYVNFHITEYMCTAKLYPIAISILALDGILHKILSFAEI